VDGVDAMDALDDMDQVDAPAHDGSGDAEGEAHEPAIVPFPSDTEGVELE